MATEDGIRCVSTRVRVYVRRMFPQVCVRAATPSRLEVAVAVTTEATQTAQNVHGLEATSAIALGRLLTSAGLMAATSKVEGKTSLQILSRGRIGQLFVDVTDAGDLRGLVKNPNLAFPCTRSERIDGRRSVGPAVHPGEISAVRRRPTGEYFQSMTPLTTGEVDADIEAFLERSDQVPTVLVADTLVDRDGRVVRSGGVLVQALPDGDRTQLREIGRHLADGRFAQLLAGATTMDDLLRSAVPDAERADADQPLRWHCPCSRERAENALRLLGQPELARMVVEAEPVVIDCDFCRSRYELTPDDLAELLAQSTTARA